MKIEAFLSLVEIRTKVASVIPYLAGGLYAIQRFDSFKPLHMFIFFISLITIDMATTAINNYMDFKRAKVKAGYNYENHNAMVNFKLSEKMVVGIIFLLLLISIACGILLFLLTDIVILLIGIVSIGIGIIYSFGPIPISHTPFGEIVSGFIMGGFIFFISVYINIYESGIVFFTLSQGIVHVSIDVVEIFIMFFVSAPLIFTCANIMLANNLCDVDEDVINKRYTLPHFLGHKLSLIVYRLLYLASYLCIFISIILGWLPIISGLVFVTIPIVIKHTGVFLELQSKKDTFILTVKNYLIIGVSLSLSLFISIILELLLDYRS